MSFMKRVRHNADKHSCFDIVLVCERSRAVLAPVLNVLFKMSNENSPSRNQKCCIT